MNVVIEIDDFKIEHAFFTPPVKNLVIEESSFIKLIYSNSITSLNCIYIQVPIRILYIERYFNKLKYSFDNNDFHNREILEKLYLIEKAILGKINIKSEPVLHLYNKLSSGVIKMDTEREHINVPDRCVLLKISGVWETKHNYGLTFKFV
jgi:hypothetical protein